MYFKNDKHKESFMSADELKAMPKGQFVVMKTGAYPMKVRLKLFFEWGISFGKPYEAKENAERKVEYADRKELTEKIAEKYCPDLKSEETGNPKPSGRAVGQVQVGARRNISPDGRKTDRPFLRMSVKRELPFKQVQLAKGEEDNGQA